MTHDELDTLLGARPPNPPRLERPFHAHGPAVEYVMSVLVALDQLANALTGGNPDMTISARIGQFAPGSAYWGTLERLVDWAFAPIQRRHCWKAFISEIGRSDRKGSKLGQTVIGITIFLLMPLFGVAVRLAATLRKK